MTSGIFYRRFSFSANPTLRQTQGDSDPSLNDTSGKKVQRSDTYTRPHSLKFCALLCLAAVLSAPAAPAKNTGSVIRNYRLFLAMPADTQSTDSLPVALRRFSRNDSDFIVTVNPRDLSLSIVPFDMAASSLWRAFDWQEFINAYRESTYGKAILEARRAVLPIQDAGFNRILAQKEGISLTVDLCPSRRPLDRFFFDTLITALSTEESPVPIGIAITGAWIKTHRNDLEWLVNLERQNRIHITWINHSYNHHVLPDRHLSKNFLLDTACDLNEEVLGTERLLIEKGLMPTLFFRFPGLVSSPELIVRVVSFGLIPVGSDAWLAKEQMPRSGSIVLVHANGNEPFGLQKFVSLLAEKRDSIRRKEWFLYDLRSSVIKALDSAATPCIRNSKAP
ncbi:MAG: hypothetical protein JXA71_09110 [Chitinispirillaceae bacterium]|nr:hypothetical protein [Chitinispirillaceae bacterium]